MKLASELQKRSTGRTVYVLDEPTTGLHFEDISKLINVLSGLVDKGNTVIVIEHNLDVIKTADWVVDMGPEGGNGGGLVVAEGTPEEVAAVPASHTGKFLRDILGDRVSDAAPARAAGEEAGGQEGRRQDGGGEEDGGQEDRGQEDDGAGPARPPDPADRSRTGRHRSAVTRAAVGGPPCVRRRERSRGHAAVAVPGAAPGRRPVRRCLRRQLRRVRRFRARA